MPLSSLINIFQVTGFCHGSLGFSMCGDTSATECLQFENEFRFGYRESSVYNQGKKNEEEREDFSFILFGMDSLRQSRYWEKFGVL